MGADSSTPPTAPQRGHHHFSPFYTRSKSTTEDRWQVSTPAAPQNQLVLFVSIDSATPPQQINPSFQGPHRAVLFPSRRKPSAG